MRNKYLVFRHRLSSRIPGETVAQVCVNHLNKKGISDKWDELQKKFPSDQYISCLTETKAELREFMIEI